MRTTVALDSDLVEQLKALAKRRNVSFSVALNDAIRAGLPGMRGGPRPFKVHASPMGLRPGIDLTHALRMADELEDEEIFRRPKRRN